MPVIYLIHVKLKNISKMVKGLKISRCVWELIYLSPYMIYLRFLISYSHINNWKQAFEFSEYKFSVVINAKWIKYLKGWFLQFIFFYNEFVFRVMQRY